MSGLAALLRDEVSLIEDQEGGLIGSFCMVKDLEEESIFTPKGNGCSMSPASLTHLYTSSSASWDSFSLRLRITRSSAIEPFRIPFWPSTGPEGYPSARQASSVLLRC